MRHTGSSRIGSTRELFSWTPTQSALLWRGAGVAEHRARLAVSTLGRLHEERHLIRALAAAAAVGNAMPVAVHRRLRLRRVLAHRLVRRHRGDATYDAPLEAVLHVVGPVGGEFWSGVAGFTRALDEQLLAYATWRDTKLALIVFVKQADFGQSSRKRERRLRLTGRSAAGGGHRTRRNCAARSGSPEAQTREAYLSAQFFHMPLCAA